MTVHTEQRQYNCTNKKTITLKESNSCTCLGEHQYFLITINLLTWLVC